LCVTRAFVQGRGFRVVLALQNLAQLDEVYGKAVRETTVAACATQLYIRIDDLENSDTLSKMLGETTIEIKRASFRSGADVFRHKTVSIDYDSVPLRTPQQLRQMDARKVILLVSSSRPFELDRVIYHDDSPYRQALRQVQFKSVEVPELMPYADKAPAALDKTALDSPRRERAPTARDAPMAAENWERRSASAAKPGPDVGSASSGSPVPDDPTPAPQTAPVKAAPATEPVEAAAGLAPDRPSPAALDAKDGSAPEPAPSRAAMATDAPPAGSVPIQAIAAAQFDAAAAAWRSVIAAAPENPDQPDIAHQLRQLGEIAQNFGDDAVQPVDVEPQSRDSGNSAEA
jgi:type IV secretion system protein VirD4